MSDNAGENQTERGEKGGESLFARRERVARELRDGARVSLSRRCRAKNWIATFPRVGMALAFAGLLSPLAFLSVEISNACAVFGLCVWAAFASMGVALGEDGKLGTPSQSAAVVGFMMSGVILFGGAWFAALMNNVVEPSTAKTFVSQVDSSEALGNLAWSRVEKVGVVSSDGERAAAVVAIARFEASKDDAYKTARTVAAAPWKSWDASLSENPRSSFQHGYFVDTMSERLRGLQALSANIATEQLISQEKNLIGQTEKTQTQRQSQAPERVAKGDDADAKWLADRQREQLLSAMGLDMGNGSGGWDFAQSQGLQTLAAAAPLSGLEGPAAAFNRDGITPLDDASVFRAQMRKTEESCKSRNVKSIPACMKFWEDEKGSAYGSLLAPASYAKGLLDPERPVDGGTREQALARAASIGEARLQWAPPAHAPQIDYDQVASDAARRAMSAERIGAVDMGAASMSGAPDSYQNRASSLAPMNFVSGSQYPRVGGYAAAQAPQMKPLSSENAQALQQGHSYPSHAARLAMAY